MLKGGFADVSGRGGSDYWRTFEFECMSRARDN